MTGVARTEAWAAVMAVSVAVGVAAVVAEASDEAVAVVVAVQVMVKRLAVATTITEGANLVETAAVGAGSTEAVMRLVKRRKEKETHTHMRYIHFGC